MVSFFVILICIAAFIEFCEGHARIPIFYPFIDKEIKQAAKALHKLIEENEGELRYGSTSRLYTISLSFSRPLTDEEEGYLHNEVNFRTYSYPHEKKTPMYEIGVGDHKVIGYIEVYDQ